MIRILAAVIAALLIFAVWQRGSIHSAKRGAEQAQAAQAEAERERDAYKQSAFDLAAQSSADRKAMAQASERAQAANKERDDANQRANRILDGIRSGQLRLKPQYPAAQAKAHPAGNPAAPQNGAQCGVPAGLLEYVAGKLAEADQVVIERNEAVDGWRACRAISEGEAAPAR